MQDSDSGVISWNGSSGGMKVISRSTSNFDSRTHWWNLVRLTGYTSLARHPQVSAHEMLFDCSTCSCVVNRSNLMLLFLGDSQENDACTAIHDVTFIQRVNSRQDRKHLSSRCSDFLCPNHLDFTWFYHNLPVISWHGQNIATWPHL